MTGYIISTVLWTFSLGFFSFYKIVWLPFVSTLFQAVVFVLFNRKIKQILIEKYNCTQKGFLWDVNELNQYKLIKIERILLRYQFSGDKLSRLSEILNKEAENRKLTNYIGLGLIAVIFVPLWSEFVGWVYDRAQNINEALLSVGVMLICSIMLWFTLWILKVVLELFDNRSMKIKELSLIIDKISLKK